MRVLIGIPVYNERKYVDRVLSQILSYHRDVLLVDDGSTDGTAEYLAGRGDVQLIRHPSNNGYGQSMIDAFDYADRCGYDWVLTMDCDEQHEPARIPDFLRAIRADRHDLISGSRYLKQMAGDNAAPGARQMVNAAVTAMVNETFGWHLTDTFCGFKAHRVAAMRKLNLTETGYAFPLQLWPQVYRADLRVTEIPVERIYNDPNRSFGAHLDDAGRRLQHYRDVFHAELAKPWPPRTGATDESAANREFCCCEA